MSNLVMLSHLQKTGNLCGISIKRPFSIVYKHFRSSCTFYIHKILRGFSTFEHLRLVEIKSVVSINQWINLMVFLHFSLLCGYVNKYVWEINCSKFLQIQIWVGCFPISIVQILSKNLSWLVCFSIRENTVVVNFINSSVKILC